MEEESEMRREREGEGGMEREGRCEIPVRRAEHTSIWFNASCLSSSTLGSVMPCSPNSAAIEGTLVKHCGIGSSSCCGQTATLPETHKQKCHTHTP